MTKRTHLWPIKRDVSDQQVAACGLLIRSYRASLWTSPEKSKITCLTCKKTIFYMDLK